MSPVAPYETISVIIVLSDILVLPYKINELRTQSLLYNLYVCIKPVLSVFLSSARATLLLATFRREKLMGPLPVKMFSWYRFS